MGGLGGQSSGTASYSAVKEIASDETIKDETYSSENSDENAVLATGSITAQLSDTTITKTGDSDGGDTSNFYGNNSGITAKDGAALTLKNMKITTDASSANGVFSYSGSATTSNSSGDGTSVTISDSKITTTGDNAGGSVDVTGGTYTTTGIGSPSSNLLWTRVARPSIDLRISVYPHAMYIFSAMVISPSMLLSVPGASPPWYVAIRRQVLLCLPAEDEQ